LNLIKNSFLQSIQTRDLLNLVLLAVICYFPLFLQLDNYPLRMWDESFYANSAYEMNRDNSWLIKHFDGQPDTFNLKPPLITWSHAALFRFFGINELNLRLPSAISALFTCFLLFFILLKLFQLPVYISFLSVIVLLGSKGFVTDHVTRTGDFDAPLSLFLFLSFFFMIRIILQKGSQHVNIFGLIISIFLAVMTKGVAGLLFIPANLILLIVFKQIVPFLKSKWLYFYLLIFLSIVLTYYLNVENTQNGYIGRVLENEIFGRYFSVKDAHQAGFLYYFVILTREQFFPWIIFAFISFIISIKKLKDSNLKLFIASWIVLLTYLLIISLSKTKCQWYTAPVFPLLAIVCILPIYLLTNVKMLNKKFINYLIIAIYCFALWPYFSVVKDSFLHKTDWTDQMYGSFLYHINKNHPEIKKIKIIHDGWNSHLLFYKKYFNDELGYQIDYEILFNKPDQINQKLESIKPGDVVLLLQYKIKDYIKNKFVIRNIDRYDYFELLEIVSVRDDYILKMEK